MVLLLPLGDALGGWARQLYKLLCGGFSALAALKFV